MRADSGQASRQIAHTGQQANTDHKPRTSGPYGPRTEHSRRHGSSPWDDWEFTITEPQFDLRSLQGQIPRPFESVAERHWVAEN
jgi:hypothetical protein